MNIVVLQHIKIEDPGYIKDLMIADGVDITTIELDEGQKIPKDFPEASGPCIYSGGNFPEASGGKHALGKESTC